MGKGNVDNKEKFFEQDDNLGRDRYAEFLKNLIINSDKYKRDSDTESYVIALDSGWGTGKSYFLSMFKNYLKGNRSSESRYEGFKDEIKIIEFNAWKNDFWDNAFEPFMIALIDSGALELEMQAQQAEEVLKGLGAAVVKVAKGFAKHRIARFIGEEAVNAFEEEVLSKFVDFASCKTKIFPEYREFKDNINNLKDMLTEYIEAIDGKYKLVIIIDELDRCKPTFAIELLEIVKHLFDIKGLVFIFAVDIEQLSCSIRTVYGHEMDATGYLCRFFDYISRMPKADTGVYIKNKMKMLKDQNEEFDKDVALMDAGKIEEFINDLVLEFKLSLRDVDTILTTYNIMLNTFLKDYGYYEAHCMYLYFVTLKYKSVKMFNDIFLREIAGVFRQYGNDNIVAKYKWLEDNVDKVNQVIKSIGITLYSSRDESSNVTISVIGGAKMRCYLVNSITEDEILLADNSNNSISGLTKIVNGSRLNNLLYKPDILKWEEIKDLKYGQYIHQQLEMFDFIDAEAVAEVIV
ncbi:KAP family P-loop NTPase fold protein [[Clostridium] fimetarium]|uniref:KAP family P-loop domain-containing protein n=1 Tax=[Clostridium] fimetarium TaxID=99656 RepID=A0A1I0RDJ1_9FIRM|nr:P-loop NTPase fold protein [[Clostridium] fimetarium]SEW38889.1 KAP family P-loop domain-containing protein [[Clostridium] fimetarium]